MRPGRKVLPPGTLIAYAFLSLSAWVWIDGARLHEAGSFGFYLFIASSFSIVAILLWQNGLTVSWSMMWTSSMSIGSVLNLVVAIFHPDVQYGFYKILLWFLLQWGAVFFLFKKQTWNWLLWDVWSDPSLPQRRGPRPVSDEGAD